MKQTSFRLATGDGVELYVRRWEPDGEPKACVFISHGMAEHCGRYARFAEALTQAGYAVYGSDHRGHGETAQVPGDLGYFGDRDGFRCLVDDLYSVNRRIAADHEGLPIFLFGHSMGALVTQHYLFSHGDTISGAIICGAGVNPTAQAMLGLGVAAAERVRLGDRGKSAILQFATVGVFNLAFRPNRTGDDWLSSDPAEVDKFIADPLCGFPLSVLSWQDMFNAMIEAEKFENMRRMPAGLAVLIVAGERDPVGRGGRGPRRLASRFRRAGMQHVDSKFYPGMRHEILNEVGRDEVQRDLVQWLDSVLASQS